MTTRARRAARRSVYRRLERDDRSHARGDGAWRGPRPASATARRCSFSGDMPRLRAPFPHACKRRGRAKSSRRRASSPLARQHDCGRRADTKGQSEDGNQGEARIAAQHTCSITQVLQQSPHPVASPYAASNFLDQRDVSHFAARGIMGFVGLDAAINAVLFSHAQVAANFFVQLLFALLPVITESHALFSSADGFKIPAIASITCFQRERSEASCFLP